MASIEPIELETYMARKYPYLSADDREDIINSAKMFYYSLRFPCLPDIDETIYPIAGKNIIWCEKACDEIVERLGVGSAISYQENSISIKLDSAELSDRLCNMIIPEAGIPL